MLGNSVYFNAKSDYALIERSEGARTVVLAADGTKAWDSLKAEAVRREASQVRNTEKILPPSETVPSPLGKEGSEVRSDVSDARTDDAVNMKVTSFADVLSDKAKVAVEDDASAESGVKYKIAHTTENKPVVVIENDILDGVSKNDWVRTAKDAIKNSARKYR